MINPKRLADTFLALVRIDSVSKEEKQVADYLVPILESLNCQVRFDDAHTYTGSNVGNMIARYPGNRAVPPLFFSGHMDTVEPGRGIEPVLENGVFSSKGETILGADDKSAIAIMIEVLRVIEAHQLPCGPLELILTVCEEIGLQGAKHLDLSQIESRMGYVLDSTETDGIVTRAPGANHLTITVHGKSAHAGAEPEKGVNAIAIAATAISKLKLGRIDAVTTCNIGTIRGGEATNIIPDTVILEGEIRSHDPEMLDRVTNTMVSAFESAAAEASAHCKGDSTRPRVTVHVETDFPQTHIPEDDPVVVLARRAAARLGRTMAAKTIGGGSDANILLSNGIMAGVIGTGMTDVHTTHETVSLKNMIETAELVLAMIDLHAHA
ncbi:MAG: peptidase T [Deltaproteobacteria bacterium]|nr:MAG: peptidase T [Deltaproteobacteria bacterium]